jgi:hypothetical protein
MKKRATFDDLCKHYEALTTAALTSEIAHLSAMVEASRKPGVVVGPSTPLDEIFEKDGVRARFEMGARRWSLQREGPNRLTRPVIASNTRSLVVKRTPAFPRAALCIRRLAILRGARRFGTGGRDGSIEPDSAMAGSAVAGATRKSICPKGSHGGPIRWLCEVSAFNWKSMCHSAVGAIEAHHHSLN